MRAASVGSEFNERQARMHIGLVLSRQRDEGIMIGDDIIVRIVDIRGDKVRVGIDAPKTVAVHRQEVYAAIQREKKAAAVEAGKTAAKAT